MKKPRVKGEIGEWRFAKEGKSAEER